MQRRWVACHWGHVVNNDAWLGMLIKAGRGHSCTTTAGLEQSTVRVSHLLTYSLTHSLISLVICHAAITQAYTTLHKHVTDYLIFCYKIVLGIVNVSF